MCKDEITIFSLLALIIFTFASLFNPQGVNAADVYTAGSLDIGNRGSGANMSYFNACYWKNNVRINLHPAAAADSKASSSSCWN